MKTAYALPLLLLPLLTACGERVKHVDTVLQVQLALNQPLAGKVGEPLPAGFAEWFVPFEDEKACPGAQFYPRVEALRADQSPAVAAALWDVDPKTLAKEQVSGVRAFMGVKPKFDKIQTAMAEKIKAVTLPKTLGMAAGAAADDEIRKLISRKPAVIFVLAQDAATAETRGNTLKASLPAPQPVLTAATTPEEMRAAVIKAVCETARKKEAVKPILLVDAGIFGPAQTPLAASEEPGASASEPAPPAAPTPTQPVAVGSGQKNLDSGLQFMELARGAEGALRRDRQQRALAEFDKAIAVDPKLGLAWLNRASIYRQLGNLNQADADLASAFKLLPKHPGVHYEQALLRAVRKDAPGALKALDQALTLGFKMIDEIRREPGFREVIRDPGFETLLVRHGFK